MSLMEVDSEANKLRRIDWELQGNVEDAEWGGPIFSLIFYLFFSYFVE